MKLWLRYVKCIILWCACIVVNESVCVLTFISKQFGTFAYEKLELWFDSLLKLWGWFWDYWVSVTNISFQFRFSYLLFFAIDRIRNPISHLFLFPSKMSKYFFCHYMYSCPNTIPPGYGTQFEIQQNNTLITNPYIHYFWASK